MKDGDVPKLCKSLYGEGHESFTTAAGKCLRQPFRWTVVEEIRKCRAPHQNCWEQLHKNHNWLVVWKHFSIYWG